MDRPLRAGLGAALRDHRPHAAGVGGAADQRHLVPLAQAAAGRYSERFLRAIDHALAVRPDDRPRDAAQLRAELGIDTARSPARRTREIPTAPTPLEGTGSADDATLPPRQLVAPPLRPLPPLPQAQAAQVGRHESPSLPPPPPSPSPPTARRTPGPWLLAAALVLTAGAAWGLWWLAQADSDSARLGGSGGRSGVPAATPISDERSALPAAASAVAADAAPPPAAGQGAAAGGVETPSLPPAAPAPATGALGDEAAVRERAATAPAPPPRATPRKNSQDPRCTEIIARVSLGEELSAHERALLKGECRR